MSVFKIAYIGSNDDKKICEIAKNSLKCDPEDTFEFVDITNEDPNQILNHGSFQGVLYYNDIYSSREYALKLQSLLSMQNEKKDLSIFSLSRTKMSSIEALAEKETIAQMFYNKFDITMDDIYMSTGSGETEHDLETYFKLSIQVPANEYFNDAHEVELTVQEKVDKLFEILQEVIKEKDSYTLGHSQRVVAYVAAIAKNLESTELAFSEKEMQELLLSAMIHDLAKVLVPDSVLAKKSQLNFKERDSMGLHTENGGDFLINLLEQHPEYASVITPNVIRGVLYHHKDYDGMHGRRKGEEPDPIRGNIIGKIASVIAAGDCSDAMTSQRAYNNPKHILDFLRDLYKNRGKQFHPIIAEATIITFAQQFASLGIDPLKIVPDEPVNPDNIEIDKGLKSFLEAHADKFEVNRDAKPGDTCELGFAIDDLAYFDLSKEYGISRDPNIRFKDEFDFRAGKYAREHGMDFKRVVEDEEISAMLEKEVTEFFEAQDREGAEVMARARSREERSSLADQIVDMTENDIQINSELYKNATGVIKTTRAQEQVKDVPIQDDVEK